MRRRNPCGTRYTGGPTTIGTPPMPHDYQPAPLAPNEPYRLAALRRTQILDTPPEAAFDRLTRLASQFIGTPIALVSLVDAKRQWFKARVGLDAQETPREVAFCAHALLKPDEVLVVPDAAADPRFRGNPLVVGDPRIRFYAGAPIVTRDGHALGTVCAIDREPRADIGTREAAILKELAAVAADEIELRELARRLDQEIVQRHEAEALTLAAERAQARAEAEAIRQRAGQSLMRLTGGIAHEFNNLFTGMILLAENLEAGGDERTRGAMRLMLDALQRGSRLTNAMLAYSGKQFIEASAVDLGPLLAHAANMIPALHGKKVAVETALAEGCAPVDADGRQLLAALAELAANAVEAAAPEPAAIRLSADPAVLDDAAAAALRQDGNPDARAGRFVRIAVADRGPGMSAELRAQACEPFFTTKAVGDGPGLGLSMAQGFARQSGGFLAIQSAPDAGTTVSLYLPPA